MLIRPTAPARFETHIILKLAHHSEVKKAYFSINYNRRIFYLAGHHYGRGL